MKKLLVLILLCLFLLTLLPVYKSYAISNVSVTVNPVTRNTPAEYDIGFVTGADLIGGKDKIFITFPKGTKLPCACPHNWYLDFFEINGYRPARVGKVLDIPNTIYLCVPGGITIKKGSVVNIVIRPQVNILNPSIPGKYKIILWTTKEGKAQSDFYEITSTHIKNPVVKVSPAMSGVIASYEINFTTGDAGNLSEGQNIYIEFPAGTGFPREANKNYVLVNGKEPESISISDNIISIKISESIRSDADCSVQIESEFGISNPPAGINTLFLWTDSEPEKVEAKFEIKSEYTVSTVVYTKPAQPDGRNGFFITKPVVILKGTTNNGKAVETYYAIDKKDKFVPYGASFVIPDGIHTLYYYSTAGDLKEKVKSKIFKVDTVPPEIYLSYPDKNPFYTGETFINIRGRTSENGTLTINGREFPVDKNMTFSAEVSLKPGKNLLEIVFTDIAGNKTIKNIKVVFDTTVPDLTVYYPADWEHIIARDIEIRGKVTPANSHVFVNGQKIMVSKEGVFDYRLIPDGASKALVVLKIKAVYPLSGRSSLKTITVVYEPQSTKILLTIGSKVALVNGKKKKMDVAPFIDPRSNRTLVPVRFVVEFLGGKVLWEQETKTVTVFANGKTVKITIGESVAYVNGTPYNLDQPAVIKNNRTFVPLRFVAEALGFKVLWNGKSKTITISY